MPYICLGARHPVFESNKGADQPAHMCKLFSALVIKFYHAYLNFLQVKGVRALRGYFGPLWSQKLKVAFHQFHLTGLLEE